MSDIKLYHVGSDAVQELADPAIAIEKTLQTLIEHHLEAFLGVRSGCPARVAGARFLRQPTLTVPAGPSRRATG
jgi:hypothetical protein